ncbi:recombinase RecT [Alkalicoccus luteus]|uniref:Recombinase n=1 Tax=Alkalicoccus luteus TaxID=1237094 RepID=A0A969TVA3_9BACI|nr:recombinase RecT [Alkalicoccus luteus]NJP37897.1 recombinase [Alkalicoccus luteus]
MANELALVKKDTVDVVAGKVKQFQESGELHFPPSYSPENAMKSAWLLLQDIKTSKNDGNRPALEVCSKDSIANALLDMVVQGLNPAKKQGYFIVYGKTLAFQRSYFGTMAVTKRVTGAKEIDAAVIYEGDEVDYEIINGRIQNLKHKQKFGNINKDNIVGAYCTIVMAEGNVYTELMTIAEIRQAWSKAQFWAKDAKEEKKGSTHDEFKQEMAKKTVINRACKKFMNSSDDSSLVMNHFFQSEENAEEARARQEINENANSETLDIALGAAPEQSEPLDITPESESDHSAAYENFERQEQKAGSGPGF